MSSLLALAAAVGWGASDFAAGRASHRASVLSVVIVTHLVAVLAMAAVAIGWPAPSVTVTHNASTWLAFELDLGAPATSGAPTMADMLWGMAAGVSGGLGSALLFRGLSRGATAVVAPITAVGTALVPLVSGVATGASLTPVAMAGVATGLIAIVLVSLAPSPATDEPAADEPVADEPVADRVPVAGGAPVAARPAPGRVQGLVATPTALRLLGVSAVFGPLAGAAPIVGRLVSGNGLSANAVGTLFLAMMAAGSALAALLVLRGAPATVGVAVVEQTAPAGVAVRRAPGPGILRRAGLVEGVLSGVGFGLFFVLLDRTGAGAGLWPLVGARGTSVLMFVLAALVMRRAIVPGRGARLAAVAAGLLDGAAAALFLAASRFGVLSIVVVLTSLYPAVTIVLARAVTKERLHRVQVLGLVVAGAAVSLLVMAR